MYRAVSAELFFGGRADKCALFQTGVYRQGVTGESCKIFKVGDFDEGEESGSQNIRRRDSEGSRLYGVRLAVGVLSWRGEVGGVGDPDGWMKTLIECVQRAVW